MDNYEGVHATSMLGSYGKGYIEYSLNGEYTAFTGTIYVTRIARNRLGPENQGVWKSAAITVYGDDNVLFRKQGFQYKDRPTDFRVDVTGVSFLRIAMDYTWGMDANIVGIGEPALAK